MRPTPTLLGSSLALALATPHLVFAQANPQTSAGSGGTQRPAMLSPVTVTGVDDRPYMAPEASQSKFTAPLVDTPKSVQVIPRAVIQDSAATSLEDVLRNSPGITFGAGEGGQPLADRPFIRGSSSGGSIYVDGIRDPGGQTREIFNLEGVEVVRGADSAYGGRGSGGGSINLVSKRARLGSFTEGSLGYGSDGYRRATMDGNWQFNDRSAFRLNVLGAKGNVAGRNQVDYEKLGIAPSLSLGLGTPTRLTFSFYHLNTDDMPDYGVPTARKAPELAAGDTGILDVDRDTFYGLYDRDFRKTRADIGTIEIEHDLSERLTLRNAIRYGETVNDYVVTNPGDGTVLMNPADGRYWLQRGTKSRWQKSTMLTNVTELNGQADTGQLKHRFNFGIELSRETIRNASYNIATTSGRACPAVFGAGEMDCTPYLSPDPSDPWSGSVERAPLSLDAHSSTQAVYLFDTMDVSEAFQVNAGLRYDRYRISGSQSGRGGSVEGSSRWNTFNYQLGLVYKPAPNGSVYVSYATASTPPTVSGGDQEGIVQDMSELKPEKSSTIELGTKWNVLDERLGLTAALFQTDRKDAQIEIEPDVFEQAGKTRVRGLELGIAGQITPKWGVYGGYTYMDSELLRGAYSGVNEGDPLANTPKHSFSLWTTYKLMPALTVGAGAYYVGKRFGGNQGGAGGGANAVYMPSYWRFDAMAAYQLNKNLALQLNALNIGDKKYYSRTNGVHHADFGPGRQVILSANLRY
ncbi:TonB-dependent siderophore receptor [Pusillimonas sp.]|uniref:TonB-dependent receptor n=1 Tax=Pusillimonas sp. TaxID=3040095 RepID=UPI0029B73449|nr:TonB-dependent siderophore receptor [Pusillimonas sp.]MDX3894136.1 TonB-dependent siderophore receptor [Pusillimonas sp.]